MSPVGPAEGKASANDVRNICDADQQEDELDAAANTDYSSLHSKGIFCSIHRFMSAFGKGKG
jgi:hypothetical protein